MPIEDAGGEQPAGNETESEDGKIVSGMAHRDSLSLAASSTELIKGEVSNSFVAMRQSSLEHCIIVKLIDAIEPELARSRSLIVRWMAGS